MQFSQANKKLKELYNQVQQNTSDIENKSSQDTLLSFFKSNDSPYFNIAETEWISAQPDRSFDISNPRGCTTIQGDLLPESLSIEFNTILEIPKVLIPFVDIICVAQPPRGSKITNYSSYKSSRFFGDSVKITVDGNVIYFGPKLATNTNIPTYTTQQLDDTLVPNTHRRKIWTIEIQYVSGGDSYRIIGDVVGLHIQKNVGTGCDGAITSQWDTCKFNMFFPNRSKYPDTIYKLDKYALIDNLTTSTVTGQGDIFRVRSVSDGGGGCQIDTSSSTQNVSISSPLFDNSVMGVTDFYITGPFVSQKLVSGNWVSAASPINFGSFFRFLPANNPVVNSVSQTKYSFHYFADKDGWPTISTDFPNDSFSLSGGAYNSSPQAPGHTILFERNPEGYPSVITEFPSLVFIQSNVNDINIGFPIKTNKTFILLKKLDTNTNQYSLFYRNAIAILSPAKISLEIGQNKGDIDLFTNPNYPEANKGDYYRVGTGGGKIGGANGKTLIEGATFYCLYDKTPSGTELEVSKYWTYGINTTQNETYQSLTYFDTGYNQNITYYHITTPTNGLPYRNSKFGKIYISENADIQYKFMLVIKNPLFTKEIRQYDLTQ